MTENFKLKAYMLEQGIKISTEAENFLNNTSTIWLMKDYITCTGLTFVFDGEYATISQNQASKIQFPASAQTPRPRNKWQFDSSCVVI